MRFDLITLFPEVFTPLLTSGVTRRAFESAQVDVRLNQLRDFSDGQYRRVDDRPFGGGPGMVLMAEPLRRCIEDVLEQRGRPAPIVLFSPVGQVLTQNTVAQWAQSDGAILICGRYEGIDQRFIDLYVDQQISLGDFVLSGGEIAAMALLDAVARLQPGVLGDEGSHQLDSFNPALDGLLDSPHYTRPEVWQCHAVPPELMSGHHAHIERWRREQSLRLTALHRPELLEQARQTGRLNRQDEAFLKQSKDSLPEQHQAPSAKKL